MALARAIQGLAQPLGIPPEPRPGVLRARGEPELLRALPARRPACADGPARRRQLLPARRADGLVSAGGRAAALSRGGRSDEPGGDGGTVDPGGWELHGFPPGSTVPPSPPGSSLRP